jgi:hypothetical protein
MIYVPPQMAVCFFYMSGKALPHNAQDDGRGITFRQVYTPSWPGLSRPSTRFHDS